MSSQKQQTLTWQYPEFIQHERGTIWYFVMTLLVGALLLYSIVSGNLLFALILVLIVGLFIVHEHRGPKTLTCNIREDGIMINETLYPYSEMKDFRIVYEPPLVKMLYVTFTRMTKPRLAISLMDQSPITVRSMLQRLLPEDLEGTGETLSDVIARIFKL